MFYEMAGAVLDEETGDLFEYRHLIKHPHHKKVWDGAFGQGLPSIVKGTDTLNLIISMILNNIIYPKIVHDKRETDRPPFVGP